MLQIVVSWDWFHDELKPEEKEAIAKKQLCAVVREDGDDDAAIVEAIKGVDAPAEHIRLLRIDPLIADCFLAVAWDDRVASCVEENEDDS